MEIYIFLIINELSIKIQLNALNDKTQSFLFIFLYAAYLLACLN